MMFKRHYYYLVAGLADLAFDSGKGYADLADFREVLKSNLRSSDYYLVSLLFIPFDHDNLIAYLEKRHDEWNPLGNLTIQDFEDLQGMTMTANRGKRLVRSYLAEMIEQFSEEGQKIDRETAWKKLTESHIKLVLGSGNRFLKNWITFDRDVRNIFTLVNTRKINLDASKYIIGDDDFANELIAVFNSGKDFMVPQEPEYAPAVFKIATDTEFLERERKIDLERWNFIDSNTLFEYFTIDLILGYLIKYIIVLRWKHLEPETGKMMLRKLIDQMETRVVTAG